MGKHRNRTLVLPVILVCYSLSCVSHGHNPSPANSRSEEPITVLRPVPAVLNEETHPTIEASETNIKGKPGEPFDFKRAQFVDESHGWALGGGALYRTIDGGKTWERLPQQPEKEASFSAFFFVDKLHGWLTGVKRGFTEHYGLGNSSVIMVTDDGGKSWNLQASFHNEVVIDEIRFFNSNEGLAVGAQIIDSRSPYEELLVLKTSNGGNEWNDISEGARAVVKNEAGIPNDAGRHLEWTSASSILLLTRFGQVIRTADGGNTWIRVASFKYEHSYGLTSPTAMYRLVVDPEQRTRVVSGHIGEDLMDGPVFKGYWGELIVHNEGGWTTYELDRTPILDAVFLSDKEVLACGLNMGPWDENPNLKGKAAGVILRSRDTGKSWETIYRSKIYEVFLSLTKVKDDEFYAVSDTGTFLRFKLPR